MSAIQRKFDEAREGQKAKLAKTEKAKHSDTPWETYGAVGIWSPTGKECVAEASEPKPKETYVHHEEVEVWSEGFRKACANARHICLCVNTHERLVEALKDASSLGEIVASVKYHDEAENVLLTRAELRCIEHVFCVANKVLSEIEKGGAE